jgi:hypothetical protein
VAEIKKDALAIADHRGEILKFIGDGLLAGYLSHFSTMRVCPHVRFWHKADIQFSSANVRFWG